MSNSKSEIARKSVLNLERNRDLLNSCKKHCFKVPAPPYVMAQRCKCENCKGEMLLIELYQYARGYVAAGGNILDVVPTWNKSA